MRILIKRKIIFPDDLIDALKCIAKETPIVEVNIKRNIFFDEIDTVINKVYIKYSDEKFINPLITCDEQKYSLTYSEPSEDAGIYFDKNSTQTPYQLYLEGDLSFTFLLSQNSLKSDRPTVKCEIIDAKNVLQFRESDIYYFYKPKRCTEETIDGVEYWKMIYEVDNNCTFPNDQPFTFTDKAMGLQWNFTYDSSRKNGMVKMFRIDSTQMVLV